MTDLPNIPPSPWGNPYQSVKPWTGNHLKACKDHDHSGLCNIKEQYAIKHEVRQPEKVGPQQAE